MKILCFTCSYKRPHMLRQCILNIHSQTYTNIIHSVNLTLDTSIKTSNYDILYDDLVNDKCIINYSRNSNQNINYLTAIKNVENYESYDLFIKIDDDDIYKRNYISNIVTLFSEDSSFDIVSSKAKYQLNGFDIYSGNYTNLGGNPPTYDFNMPPTFAFNKKALECIINPTSEELLGFEDITWRNVWAKNKLIHKEVDNTSEFIWHIHGKNISTSNFLKPV